MRLRVLGDVGVIAGSQFRSFGSPKEKALATVLLLKAGVFVDTASLIELMWDRVPKSGVGNIRTYVHHVRALLADTAIRLDGSPARGFRLDPGGVPVDFAEFSAAVEAANAAAKVCDHRTEYRQLERAITIWSGPLAAGAHGSTAFTHMTDALSLARIDAEEALLVARHLCGLTDGLAADATDFLRRHPWRDRAWEVLMHTYVSRSDLPAALAAYQRYWRSREEQLGLGPDPRLARLNTELIAGKPARSACCRPAPAARQTRIGARQANAAAPYGISTDGHREERHMPMPVEEFNEFAAAVTHRLLRSAYLLTGDLDAAQDLVQETLLQIYRRGQDIAVAGALESYARTTMFRLQVSLWRRRRFRTVDLSQTHPYAEPALDPTDQVPTAVILHNALGRLPARQRAVVVLRFLEDVSVATAAQILQCSTGTVKSQSAKALAKLHELVPQLDARPEESTP